MKTIFDINGFITSTLGFSYGRWALTVAILFAVLCLCLLLTVRGGRMKVRDFGKEAVGLALWCIVVWGLARLAWAPVGGRTLWQPTQPMLVWLIAAVLIIVLFVWYFRRRRKRYADLVSATAIRRSAAVSGASKFCYALLFAAMLLCSVGCGVGLVCGESVVALAVPMLVVALALLLYAFTALRLWYLIGAVLLLAYDFLWMQQALAASHFAFMPLLAMLPLCLACILPLFSLALLKK